VRFETLSFLLIALVPWTRAVEPRPASVQAPAPAPAGVVE
jgi:hypothetical protein